MAEEKRLLTRAEAAETFGVAPARINKWVADGAPVLKSRKRGESSKYDREAIQAWLDERRERPAVGMSLEQERAQLTRIQREKAEIDLAARRGELVSRDQVVLEGQGYTKAIAAKVRALPRLLLKEGLIERSIEARVATVCADLLRDMPTWQTLEDAERAAKEADAA